MIPPRKRRPPTPATIGPYRILEELGRGGQGVVYLAQDAGGARVAIKSGIEDTPPDSPAVERLRREAEFLAVLNHPGIARAYAPLVEDGRLYVVMEYVEGQPLAERLRFGPLPRNDGLSICRQIAVAIEAAHRARVIHRDLKPANIRISPDGVAKVLDFGVAAYAAHLPAGESAAAPTTESDTSQATIVGTYGYMAPEQMMGGEVGHRADIWSFGCILFECLVGHPLFSGATFHDVFLRVACRDADLGRLSRDVPRRLQALLRQCLVRHPAGRLADIGEAVASLDSVLARRLPSGARQQPLTNLPPRANTFVGRDREIAEIASLLRFSPGVCITGPGGCGKTRLSLETGSRLVREYRDGVWFVDLSDRAGADSIAPAIAASIPAHRLSRRAQALPNEHTAEEDERLAARLSTASMLLVLDQCDLLREPLERLAAALRQRAPGVRLLLTSRERLQIEDHGVCDLNPLGVPAPRSEQLGIAHLLAIDSVRLFVERARLVQPGYVPDEAEAAAIAELCRRLEGLPLSVELAGARISSLGPAEMSQRLDSVLHETSESVPGVGGRRPRHSTLDACIQWSFDLLTTQERQILTRLSVFRGGWTLEAAEAVCTGGDPEIQVEDVRLLLTRLVNKSLVRYDTQSGRYNMLESVKAFAGDRLGPDERSERRTRHFRFFTDFARHAETRILGNEQTAGLRAVQADIDNLGAALDARDIPAFSPQQYLLLVLSLSRFWYLRAYYHEGRRRLLDAISLATDAEPLLLCQAHNSLGIMAFGLDDLPAAEAAYRASLQIILPGGRKSQIASVWDNIGLACSDQGRFEEAEAAYASAIALHEESRDTDGMVRTKLNFAYHHIRRRLYDKARELCLECLDAVRASGDRKREAVALHNLGEIAYFKGEYDAARPFFVDSIRIKDELGDRRGVSLTVYMYALVLLRLGAYDHAAPLFAKSLEIRSELGIGGLPMPQPEHDAAMAELASHLGPEHFAAAWDRGRELFDEEVVQTITTTGAPEAP